MKWYNKWTSELFKSVTRLQYEDLEQHRKMCQPHLVAYGKGNKLSTVFIKNNPIVDPESVVYCA